MTFAPTLWTLPPGSETNLIQCWFPGVHINIGGGNNNRKADQEFMANTTFAWTVDRCWPFLTFDHEMLLNLLNEHLETVVKLIQNDNTEAPTLWIGGPWVDSFEEFIYRSQGSLVRTPGAYFVDRLPAHHATHECVHPIARD